MTEYEELRHQLAERLRNLVLIRRGEDALPTIWLKEADSILLSIIAAHCKDVKQEGRKEVVDWVQEHGEVDGIYVGLQLLRRWIELPHDLWQTQLKDWGLEKLIDDGKLQKED